MSIVNDAMVVNLQVGLWKGYRLDKEASRRVTEEAGAELDAARVNKHLVPKEALKKLEQAAGAIRVHFYQSTLAWKDNGDRLLPRRMYINFIQTHQRLVNDLLSEREVFIDRTYPASMEQAEFRMGGLFNRDDYPSPAELRSKFYVNLDIDAVTTKDDFRVNMEQAQLDAIKGDMESALSKRMARAMHDVWSRLDETLSHFAAKMGSDEVFRNSTVTKLKEIVEILPDLNILDDPDLERIRADIQKHLTGYDPDELRKDEAVRGVAANEAQRIIEDMKGFMNAFGGSQ